MKKYLQNFFGSLWLSSEKYSLNVLKRFCALQTTFGNDSSKIFQNGRKCLENSQKCCYKYIYVLQGFYKRKITWSFEDIKFLFSPPLVSCTHTSNIFQHEKRNLVSPHCHVLSSMYVAATEYQFYKHLNNYY